MVRGVSGTRWTIGGLCVSGKGMIKAEGPGLRLRLPRGIDIVAGGSRGTDAGESRHWQGHGFADITEDRVHRRGAEHGTVHLGDKGQQQMEK